MMATAIQKSYSYLTPSRSIMNTAAIPWIQIHIMTSHDSDSCSLMREEA